MVIVSVDVTIYGKKASISFASDQVGSGEVRVLVVDDDESMEAACTIEELEEVVARLKAYRDGKPVPTADMG